MDVVPGLSIVADVVAEELQLVEAIDSHQPKQNLSGEWPEFLGELVVSFGQSRPDLASFDEICIEKTGGLVSCHDCEYVVLLSVAADSTLHFLLNSTTVKTALLPKNSFCVLTDLSSVSVKHSLAQSATTTRFLTFKKTTQRSRDYYTANHQKTECISPYAPTKLEMEHVHNVYDNIASHFSHTRHYPWPLVKEYLLNLPDGSLVADVGCGNGKYLKVNPNLCIIGADRSIPLLQCIDKSKDVLGCDGLKVPLRSNCFDAAICIAVLHHMSNIEHRLQVIRELARIVKTGGSILLVAWAFKQGEKSKRKFKTQDELVEWKLQNKYADTNTQARHAKLDEAKRWTIYERFCHLYLKDELEGLVNQIPGLQIQSTENSNSNWCLHIRRLKSF